MLREQAKTLDATIVGFGIGVEPWCDEARSIIKPLRPLVVVLVQEPRRLQGGAVDIRQHPP